MKINFFLFLVIIIEVHQLQVTEIVVFHLFVQKCLLKANGPAEIVCFPSKIIYRFFLFIAILTKYFNIKIFNLIFFKILLTKIRIIQVLLIFIRWRYKIVAAISNSYSQWHNFTPSRYKTIQLKIPQFRSIFFPQFSLQII